MNEEPKGFRLPIQEHFATFQGEGIHAGRGCYFIRTYGCPLKCDFCDSAGTWHPDFKPETLNRMTIDEIAARVADARSPFLVVTGGEPTIHELRPLLLRMSTAGVQVHIETSGAFDAPFHGFACVTVSPKFKTGKPPVPEALAHAHEIKLIIENANDIGEQMDALCAYDSFYDRIREGRAPVIWLHPEWSQRTSPEVLNAIVESVKRHPHQFRAGWQLHKLYKADLLDPHASKAAVPLGGNPGKGAAQ